MPDERARVLLLWTRGTDLNPILSVLRNVDVEYTSGTDSKTPAGPLTRDLVGTLQACDAVLAVVGSELRSDNFFFELGMAFALDRPTLLLCRKGLTLPSDLADRWVLYFAYEDLEPVRFQVENMVAALPRHPRDPRVARKVGLITPEQATGFMRRLDQVQRESDLKGLVEELLRATGARVVLPVKARDEGWDLSVLDEHLSAALGGPLLISLKRELPPPPTVASQVGHSLMNTALRAGAIVFLEGGPPQITFFDLHGTRYVVLIPVRELVHRLTTQTLASLVLRSQSDQGSGA